MPLRLFGGGRGASGSKNVVDEVSDFDISEDCGHWQLLGQSAPVASWISWALLLLPLVVGVGTPSSSSDCDRDVLLMGGTGGMVWSTPGAVPNSSPTSSATEALSFPSMALVRLFLLLSFLLLVPSVAARRDLREMALEAMLTSDGFFFSRVDSALICRSESARGVLGLR